MRAATGLALALALVSCVSMETIPDTWPKRYREFLQKVEMPIARRITMYLGLDTSNSPRHQPYDQDIVFYSSMPGAVRNIQIRFNAGVDKVYTGTVETSFSPSVVCITYEQLKEVGEYKPGIVIPGRHGSPGYAPPDHFVFKLDDGTTLQATIVMEKACLSSLKHTLSSRLNK